MKMFFTVLAFGVVSLSMAQPGWEVDRGAYSNTMSVVAELRIDGEYLFGEENQVAAFAGEELRGVATLQTIEEGYNQLAFLQVFGEGGEALTYKIYDATSGQVIEADNEANFQSDQLVGSISKPYLITDMHVPTDYNAEIAKVDAEPFFTPNGDNSNDIWIIRNIDEFEGFGLKIYNAMGQEVFSTENYQNDWDGTFKGETLPTDAYYYVLRSSFRPEVFRGAISLIK